MAGTLGLDGRVAVVTGASRGLGRAVAEKLGTSGCRVVVNYLHSASEANNLVEELPAGTAVAVQGDIRDDGAAQGLIDTAIDRFGRLDIFVHNAATFVPMPTLAVDFEALYQEQVLALRPLLACAGMFAKVMSGTSGRVIAVSSNGASHVIPGYVSVGLAKASLESLIRYLAVELAGKGIAVNAIATALLDKGDPGGIAGTDLGAMLASRTPAGRLSTPADVADAVALLCADEAAWIHGQVIMVDGGLGLRA